MEAVESAHDHATHESQTKAYMAVFATLMVLTGITVGASVLGHKMEWSRQATIWVGLAIAAVKAGAVALIFMHLKQEQRIFYVVALFPFALVVILITFTLGDLDRWIYMLVPA